MNKASTQSNQSKKEFIFTQLTKLCLHDLKAQKKTMSMKKFQNIPLNQQQSMQLKFNQYIQGKNTTDYQNNRFRVRMTKRRKQKLLQRLMMPLKTNKYSSEQCTAREVNTAQNIIKKCSKLKDKILKQNKIQKVRKYTQTQYNSLLQQSKWCLAVHCRRT